MAPKVNAYLESKKNTTWLVSFDILIALGSDYTGPQMTGYKPEIYFSRQRELNKGF